MTSKYGNIEACYELDANEFVHNIHSFVPQFDAADRTLKKLSSFHFLESSQLVYR